MNSIRVMVQSACIAGTLLTGCSNRETQHDMSVADSAGVRMVRNAPTSAGLAQEAFSLQVEQRIDADSAGLMRIGGVRVDQSGNLYVLDLGQRHVVRLNPGGTFDRVLARGGTGPGELGSDRLQLFVDSHGALLIVDTEHGRPSDRTVLRWDG